MDPSQIAAGLASAPLAWICAILIVVAGYLFRELRAADRLTLERADAAYKANLDRLLPLADKLADAVIILEKLSAREGQG